MNAFYGEAGRTRRWLGVLAAALVVLFTSCTGSAIQDGLQPSDSNSPALQSAQLPPSLEASLPPVPLDLGTGDRGTSVIQNLSLNGAQTYLRSSGATDQGTALSIISTAGALQWGMYQFSAPAGTVKTLIINATASVGSSDWVAIANYSTKRWEFHGPYPATPGVIGFASLGTSTYMSPQNKIYALAISYGSGSFNVTSLSASVDDGLAATYDIGGTITKNVGGALAGVTMTLTPGNLTTTTNASGAYSFTGLAAGNYVVTPSLSGWNFTPGSQNVAITTSSQNSVNFVATQQVSTYSVSGTVTKSVGGALAGVTLTLTPGGASATSDASGNFTISNVANGSYTLTPTLSGYSFTPPSKSVNVSNANVTAQNFTGATQGGPPWTVSGTVVDGGGQPVSGAIIFVPFLDLQATTDAQGHYSISGLATNADFHLVPSKNSYDFEPPVVYHNLSNNMVQDFVATAVTLPSTVSFATHLQGQLLDGMCTVCHSSALKGSKRHGAPLGVDFDTYGGTNNNQKTKINTTCQDGSMPDPAFGSLGLTAYQKQLVQKWADQAFPQ